MNKTLKYRGKVLEIKKILYSPNIFTNDPKSTAVFSQATWNLVIDPYAIEVKPAERLNQDLIMIFIYNPPLEIVKETEWTIDKCCFWQDGSIISDKDIKEKKKSEIIKCIFFPEYVGFFKLPPELSREDFKYKCPKYEYNYIPIPIQCAVRDMIPEERLLLSHDEKLTEKEREQKQEAEEQARFKLIQENAALRIKAGLTLKEALAEFMKFDLPGVSTGTRARIKEAVMLYSRPEFHSLSKVAREFKVTPKTVSTWLKTFTDQTGFPVVQFEKHQSVRAQAEIQKTTGAKHIPKRLSSDM